MRTIFKSLLVICIIVCSAASYAHTTTTSLTTQSHDQVFCSDDELASLITMAQNDPAAQPKSVSAVQAWIRKIGCAIVLKYFALEEYMRRMWAKLFNTTNTQSPLNQAPAVTPVEQFEEYNLVLPTQPVLK